MSEQIHSANTLEGDDTSHQRIGELLIKEGLINQEQLAEALEKQKRSGGKTFEILLRLGHLDKDKLHTMLSKQPGIASIDLSRMNLDKDIIKLIPHEMALEQLVLPIDRLGKLLTVAMACPLDTHTIRQIESMSGLRVKAMLCRLDDIVVAVESLYRQRELQEISIESLGIAVSDARSQTQTALKDKLDTFDFKIPESIAKNLIDAASDARVSLDKLGGMLEVDPVTLFHVLDVVNSPLYGMTANIDTSAKAMVVLNKKGISSLFRMHIENKTPLKQEWTLLSEQAIRCGVVAAALVEALGITAHKNEVRCAGILCWLGRFALMELAYPKYKFINHDLVGVALCEEERKLFDVTHSEVNEIIIRRAGLNDRLANVVRFYTSPGEAESQNELLAMLSNIGAHAAVWKDTHNEAGLAACNEYMKTLGITHEDVKNALLVAENKQQ